jgi:hypothetical protein
MIGGEPREQACDVPWRTFRQAVEIGRCSQSLPGRHFRPVFGYFRSTSTFWGNAGATSASNSDLVYRRPIRSSGTDSATDSRCRSHRRRTVLDARQLKNEHNLGVRRLRLAVDVPRRRQLSWTLLCSSVPERAVVRCDRHGPARRRADRQPQGRRRLARLEQQSGPGRIRTIHLLDHHMPDAQRQAEMERLVRSGEASQDGVFIHFVMVGAGGQVRPSKALH